MKPPKNAVVAGAGFEPAILRFMSRTTSLQMLVPRSPGIITMTPFWRRVTQPPIVFRMLPK
jgi:hypothetical protein